MSGLTGKGSLSIKKQEVAQSRLPAVAFRKVRALHKCTLDQVIINLTSLTSPSASEAKNYSAPNPSLLASINLTEIQDNVTVKSTIRGELLQNVSFVVSGSSTLELQFEAEENEILEITIDNVARTGATLVDARPLVVTGTLAAGQTDFNVGEPFKVGEFPLAQHGAVIVMVDNQPMYRNTANQPPGLAVEGDYYEVHAGGGLGTIIRFNMADLVNDRTVSVISIGSLVERPNGSQMAFVESVQGQIDAMIPTLAALAGVDETDFQSVPNQVDLKAFGDLVLSLKQRLDNVTFDNYDYVEFGGGIRQASNRITSMTQLANKAQGAFDVSTFNSAGELKVLKDGWYSFTGKLQLSANGTSSITRGNSVAINGNNTDVLCSVVPVVAQEHLLEWTGWLAANTIISFNANIALSANTNVQMFFGSYLGTRNLSNI